MKWIDWLGICFDTDMGEGICGGVMGMVWYISRGCSIRLVYA